MPDQPVSNPLAALHSFAAHLDSRIRSGQERLWMTAEARSALKEIIRMKPGRRTFHQPPSTQPAPPPPTPAAEPTPIPPPPLPPISPSLSPSVSLSLPRSEQLAAIARRAEASTAARALGTLRDKMVFATGNPDAQIMFVGEAPGAQEERLGEPFVGPAGQKLNDILNAMGLERSTVYITNICKFRPLVSSSQGTDNRKPTLAEMQTCLEYVHEEIAVIKPKVIVALGATAAEGLLQRAVTVGQVRGQWLECQGIPLIVTYHPSYLLYREKESEATASAEKRKVWETMLMVMKRLEMPISDKQRRFFLPKS